jgi:hypothetical protein
MVGLIIIVRELTLRTMRCVPNNTEYRWVPRTMDMDLHDSKNVTKIFENIFQRAEPWVGVPQNEFIKKQEINFDNME